VRDFLETEASGGVVLLGAAVIALVWANSPWRGGYHDIWGTELTVGLGRWALTEDLHHWVNDALMAIFFFVVGLEIKRELVKGDLRDPRTAAVPAIAALGGMLVPAALYLACNAGQPGGDGWGIPMATDIAFAVGVLALFGPRVSPSLKLFLLTLAIVDDIGAIAVIAFFYTDDLDAVAAVTAVALIGAIVVMRRLGVQWLPGYAVVGAAVWLATYNSGIHATIAGVVLGLLTPARPLAPATVAREWASHLDDDPGPAEMATLTGVAKASVSTAERLEHELHPWTSFVIVPIFALANAGVELRADAFEQAGTGLVALGVVLGLVVGKALGITAATWLAVRSGIGRLPEGATWGGVVGVAAVAGIGFTVSLFVADLAFAGGALEDAAKVGILAASVLAAAVGSAVLLRAEHVGEHEPGQH
jgi:NhaA family Na+:H+ antiporter